MSQPSSRWINWRVELHVFVGLLSIHTCSWVKRLSSFCAKIFRRLTKWPIVRKKWIISYNKKKVWGISLARYAPTAPLLHSVKSGFSTLVNKRALRTISIPCVLHRHALESKALREYLKIFLKHKTERVHFITARACLSKGFSKG